MVIKRIQRSKQDRNGELHGEVDGITTGAHLNINNGYAELSGPRFKYIAAGKIESVSMVAGWHLGFTVLREVGLHGNLVRERWDVEFEEIR